MINMQLMDPGSNLDVRIQQAFERGEWNLVAALLPVVNDSLLSENSDELLEVAFELERDGEEPMPGLTVKLRRALAEAVGLIYVDSFRNKFNGEPFLALPALDASQESEKRKLIHDVAALRVAFASDPTIDPRDEDLIGLARFIDGLTRFSDEDKQEVIACIEEVASSGAGYIRTLLAHEYRDGEIKLNDYYRWSFGAQLIMSTLDDRLPVVAWRPDADKGDAGDGRMQ